MRVRQRHGRARPCSIFLVTLVASVAWPAAAGAQDRLYLQLEGGGSAHLTAPQSTQFTLGFHTSARLGVRIVGPLGVHAFGSFDSWGAAAGQIDPNTGVQTASGTLGVFGGGLRLGPQLPGSLGTLYLDLDAGVGFTGSNFQQPVLGAGLGWNIPLGGAFAVGPVVRYAQVLASGNLANDARTLTFGLAVAAPGAYGERGAGGQGQGRVYFQLEGGGSAFLTSPQSSQFGVGFYGAGRLGLRLFGPVGVHVVGGASYWAGRTGQLDPNTGAQTASGNLAFVGGGLRIAPELSASLGNLYLDVDAGVGFTGSRDQAPLLGVGLGWNIPVERFFALGPVVRYAQMLSGNAQTSDARMLTFGLAVALPGAFPGGHRDDGPLRPPERLYAQIEAGAALHLTAPQSSQFGAGFTGGARVGVRLFGPVGVHVVGSYGYWAAITGQIDPNTGRQSEAGSLTTVGGGVRIAPEISRALGRIVVDLEAGVGFTGSNVQQPVLSAGLGWNIPLGTWVAMGPVVRYTEVLSSSNQAADARILSVGLAFALPGARELPPPPPPPMSDLDGDGVPDGADLCPSVPQGPRPDATRTGCPVEDRDNDGVRDADDRCPEVPAGPRPDPAMAGCPLGDRDHDGVLDPADQCPDEPAGPRPDAARPGCPTGDRDHDGVLDPDDQCPEQPAGEHPDAARPGCPAAPPTPPPPAPAAVSGGHITITEPIFFDTDRATIQPRSFGVIDGVARVMTEHAEITSVRVEGHTDDQGRARRNLTLSRNRALAVVAYLTQHGIAAGRLTSEGYGSTRPAVPGRTEAARAANRRVEFVITGGPLAAPGAAAGAPAGAEDGHHHGHHGHHGGGDEGGGHHGHHGGGGDEGGGHHGHHGHHGH